MPHLRPAIITILGAALLAAPVFVLTQTPGTDWELGDVFVAIGLPSQGTGGKHDVYAGDGQAKGETLLDAARGFTGGCALDPRTGYLWTTSYLRNTVTTFDDLHPHAILHTINTRPASGALAVESIVFDKFGNLYVSSVLGRHQILKYSPDGQLLATYADIPIPPGHLGLWMDLSSDQETMFYTTRDSWVRTYNLRTGESGTFGRIPEEIAFGLRLLPPGDGNGGVLVGAADGVHRLDGTGTRVTGYGAADDVGYFALAVTPDGQSFWTATLSGEVYRFHIGSLALTAGPIDTGVSRAHGICVKQGYTAAEGACYVMGPFGRPVLDDNLQPIPMPCHPIELCGNGVDDDGDGLSDSGDSDCVPPGTVERCYTPGDDDHNGLVNETCPRTNRVGQTIDWQAPVEFAAPDDGSSKAYGATGLPPGLSLDPSAGAVSGAFLEAGSYPVTISVTRTLFDGTTLASSGSFTWTVTTTPPVLLNPGDQTSTEDDAVHLQIEVSDPDGDSLTCTATGLPPGLQIDALTGVISGTLSSAAAGTYDVTVFADDGYGSTVSIAFAWTVLDNGGDTVIDSALTPPQARKQAVRDVLGGLPLADGTKGDKHIQEAIAEINKGLEEYDDPEEKRGNKVFDHDRRAVKALLKIYRGDACGDVDRLVLRYTGAGPVDIDILNKKDRLIRFPGTMSGDQVQIDASELLRGGVLTPAVTIVVDGVANAQIHTTCWQPAAEGDVYGDFVIDELARVPGDPPKKPQESAATQAVIQAVISELVAADRVVIQTRLDQVEGLVAVNPARQAKVDREIALAEADMVKAAADEAAGKPDKVISRYGKAWSHVAKAERAAEKP